MRGGLHRRFVKGGFKVELVLPLVVILLAFFLAISPTILLAGTDAPVSDVSRSDLTDGQLQSIVALEPATTPRDVAAGSIAIRDVVLTDEGSLLVAGSFVNSISLGEEIHTSHGSRDVFIAELTASGVWLWSAVGGGSGADEVSSISVDADGVHALGVGHGNLTFGDHNEMMSSKYGQNSWQADLTHHGEWLGLTKIDSILLPEDSSTLWCGFR